MTSVQGRYFPLQPPLLSAAAPLRASRNCAYDGDADSDKTRRRPQINQILSGAPIQKAGSRCATEEEEERRTLRGHEACRTYNR